METVSTKLEGIAKVAQMRPREKFTSLAHLINFEMLEQCHREMKPGKASGIDKMTKDKYSENLTENLENLITRMKKHSYRPQPVRRVYIAKPGTDKQRPLGIPAYEDKLVQAAIAKILNAIYEQKFVETSYGYRPNRSPHDALKALNVILHERPINYIVDVDIRGFFDHVDHQWMMKFIEHDIADPNILRYIKRFLKSGVMEDGQLHHTMEGTPQGGVVSPVLANVYLHYVQDLWFEKVVKKALQGAAYMIRFADDSIFCFEREEDAQEFYTRYQERLKKFNLEIAEEKSKIIYFSVKNSIRESGTFDFLGFTHYIGQSQNKRRRVKRKTCKKKYKSKMQEFKTWLRINMHEPLDTLTKSLNRKLRGYYGYYGITDNIIMLKKIREEIKKMLHKLLNRRSREHYLDWEAFKQLSKFFPIAKPRITVSIFELRQERGYIL
jgi:group II intron reverse transcriptase/maturase